MGGLVLPQENAGSETQYTTAPGMPPPLQRKKRWLRQSLVFSTASICLNATNGRFPRTAGSFRADVRIKPAAPFSRREIRAKSRSEATSGRAVPRRPTTLSFPAFPKGRAGSPPARTPRNAYSRVDSMSMIGRHTASQFLLFRPSTSPTVRHPLPSACGLSGCRLRGSTTARPPEISRSKPEFCNSFD